MIIKDLKSFEQKVFESLKGINLIFYEMKLNYYALYALDWNDNRPADMIIPNSMKYLLHLHYKNFVIEAFKLLGPQEVHSVFKLLNLIQKEDRNTIFNLDTIKKHHSVLKDSYMNVDIVILRNRVFAHLDGNYEHIEYFEINDPAIKLLVDNLREIITNLNSQFKIANEWKFDKFANHDFFDLYNQIYLKVLQTKVE